MNLRVCTSRSVLSDNQQRLLSACRNVALNSGTERAFTGKTVNGYSHDTKSKGVWVSAIGGLPLFDSSTKFDSGTGTTPANCFFPQRHRFEQVVLCALTITRTAVAAGVA